MGTTNTTQGIALSNEALSAIAEYLSREVAINSAIVSGPWWYPEDPALLKDLQERRAIFESLVERTERLTLDPIGFMAALAAEIVRAGVL